MAIGITFSDDEFKVLIAHYLTPVPYHNTDHAQLTKRIYGIALANCNKLKLPLLPLQLPLVPLPMFVPAMPAPAVSKIPSSSPMPASPAAAPSTAPLSSPTSSSSSPPTSVPTPSPADKIWDAMKSVL
jgi:hypothetical protein